MDKNMKNTKKWVASTLVTSMLILPMTACDIKMDETGSGAALGALAGAATGAVIGGATSGRHNRGGHALVGAGIGAVAGAAVGAGVGYYVKQKREKLEKVQNVQVAEVPAAQTQEGTPIAEHVTVRIGAQFLFPVNSATLSPEGIAKVTELAQAIMDNENPRIIVKGYTSSEGGDGINLPLSRNRAEAVKNVFMARHIDGSRITPLGMGSMEPIGDNNTEEGRMLNRRVEIEIYQH
ncbi:TPA: hypothetical protein DDW35_11230 [Candidatus Sumerlaeota bacterium]|jgi:outer membrane protein OmpA-like peptidoglycan-associated protein|nr:hypothetical protein [Candidatus Sumerlaeota bacterium]